MALSIINSIVSWILKKRIHQIELFMKYPHEVQNELLLNLIQRAKYTEIGKKYDFSSVLTYEQFADRVPVAAYEDVEPLIERSRKGETNIYWP
ncbi:MAG: GH3 auxin-responsive promoter family protein, partial [Myroides sp.]